MIDYFFDNFLHTSLFSLIVYYYKKSFPDGVSSQISLRADNSNDVSSSRLGIQLKGIVDTYCHNALLNQSPNTIEGEEGKLKQNNDQYQLVQVHALFRHGDRTPESRIQYLPRVTYECGMVDGWLPWRRLRSIRIQPHPLKAVLLNGGRKTKLFHGYRNLMCKNGQLTFKGFTQHRSLGMFFRLRYNSLFLARKKKLQKDPLFVQSTDIKRTIHSAGAFLMGFYSKDSNISPTSIYVSRGALLEVPPPGNRPYYPYCSQLAKFKEIELISNSSYWNIRKTTNDVVNKLLNSAGIVVKFDTSIVETFDPIWCRLCHNKPLPCPSHSSDINTRSCINESLLIEGANSAHLLFSNRYPPSFSILASQPYLYHTIIQSMYSAVYATAKKKDDFTRFSFSFGHDSNILSLMSNLGVRQKTWSPYASRIVFELWQDKTKEDSFFVRVLFNGRSIINHFPIAKDLFVADGQLVDYHAFNRSFTTGPLRDLNSYTEACQVPSRGRRKQRMTRL